MPRLKQFNQNEVLEKAMNLFWEKGFHATSMQNLVDYLEINRASIYSTFESKSELFNKAIFLYQEREVKRIADFLYQYINVRQGLYYLLESEIKTAYSNSTKRGCFLINSIAELANSEETLCELMGVYQRNFEQAYSNYLQYGVNQGQISPYKDIKAIANFIFVLQGGIKTISKVPPKAEEILKMVNLGISVLD